MINVLTFLPVTVDRYSGNEQRFLSVEVLHQNQSQFIYYQFWWKVTLFCFKFSPYTVLQPRNYQVRKEVVHELEFGDIAVMQI